MSRVCSTLCTAGWRGFLASLLACGPLLAQTPPPPVPPAAPAPVPGAATPPPVAPTAPPVPSQLGRLSPLVDAPAWGSLQKFSKVLTAEEFSSAFGGVYNDSRHFPPPWETDPTGITVPTGATDGSKVRIEFRTKDDKQAAVTRYWRRASELPPLQGKPVLSGLRIALDPGHIGGAYAQMEERYLSFRPDEHIAEGELSLKVAQLLKPRLEALGAVVLMVRDATEPVTAQRPGDMRALAEGILREHGITQPKESYAGVAGDEKVLTLQYQTEKMFYRESEIRARGRKVNEQLRPDVVLCMHFNAASWGDPARPSYARENHLHLLVNGCYAADELQLQDVRFEMLQRLFSKVDEEELPLAETMAGAMAQSTGLPPFVYLTPNARQAGKTGYVYARNLLANRIYQCPVIYLEPYVMNNEETYQRLLMGEYQGATLYGGRLRTSIFEDYVQGIVAGLTNYYRQARKS